MSSRRHRLRPARGGSAPRPAAAVPRRSFRLSLALALVLGATTVVAGIVVVWWRHSTPTPLSESAPPLAGAGKPSSAPASPQGAGPIRGDPEFLSRMRRANELLAEDKPADAAQVLNEAMRLNPRNEDVHYNLGMALARMGKPEEAILEYKEALRLFPDYAEAHNNLGNLLMRLGRNDEAIEQFEQALKSMSDYAAAHNNLGTALRKAGRTNDATAHFEEAVKINPEYWQAHFNLGTSRLQEGRLGEARTEFETVQRFQPDFKPAQASLKAIEARESGGPLPHP